MKNVTKCSARRLYAKELPVSRKFYKNLRNRVDDVIRAVFMEPNTYLFDSAYSMIDYYLTHNTLDDFELPPVSELRVIFLTLKAEIDRARERSLRARERARNRSALKNKETTDSRESQERVSKPVSEPAEDTDSQAQEQTMPQQEAEAAEESMDHQKASKILLPYIRRQSHRYVITISKKEALEKLNVPEGLYDSICDDIVQANLSMRNSYRSAQSY